MTRVVPVSFTNRDGARLAGVIEEPMEGPTRPQAVVLLSPGVKTRIAPHGLYRKLAAVLTRLGFRVLRFDFYGLGDSEGTVTETSKRELYASIQVGRYVGDTAAALDWMQQTYGTSTFIVGGLCGGAITGVLAAPSDPRVVGILGLGLPVTLDAPGVDSTRFMSVGQLKGVRGRYLRKILDPKSWLRVLRLQTDFRLLFKALTVRHAPVRPPAASPTAADDSNPLLFPNFLKLLQRGCRVQLVFSEVDRLTSDYEEKFRMRHEAALAPFADLLDVRVIPSANHVLTLAEWQRLWFDFAASWCEQHFPAPRRAESARSE